MLFVMPAVGSHSYLSAFASSKHSKQEVISRKFEGINKYNLDYQILNLQNSVFVYV